MSTPTLPVKHCQCGTALLMLPHERDRAIPDAKRAPITALPVPNGNILVDPQTASYRVIPQPERAAYGATLRLNHFANCPLAGKFTPAWREQHPTPTPREEHPVMAGRGLNKVQIIGNLGRDPEMKYTQGGKAITTFSVAVGRITGQGEARQEETEWFRCVAWEKLAETCNQFLHKGSKVYVEGRLQTRKWTADDGEHSIWEIVVGEMLMLDNKPTGAARPAAVDVDDDEIPF